METRRGIKWFLCIKIQYIRYKIDPDQQQGDRDTTIVVYLRTKCITALPATDIDQLVSEAFRLLMIRVLEFGAQEGSNWVIDFAIKLDLNVATYQPVRGRSYIPLPAKLANKKAIINVKNNDDLCFLWSILAALHPAPRDPQRTTWYRQQMRTLKFDEMPMPVESRKLKKFEEQNNLAVNVFGYENEVYPLYITDRRDCRHHVNLLLITNGEKRHYCLISDLDRLLYDNTKGHRKHHHCPYCLHGYINRHNLEEHMPHCGQHGPQRTRLPTEEEKWLSFKGIQKQLRVPYVIYGDFETFPKPVEKEDGEAVPDPTKSYTEKRQHHRPSGYSYTVIGLDADHSKPTVVYRGTGVVDNFLLAMEEEEEEILTKLKEVKPMKLSKPDWRKFDAAVKCHICDKPLNGDKVRDHCHVSGVFRGAAHNSCNLNFRFKPRIPVIMHNLRGFDSHLIVPGLGRVPGRPIKCIPNNMEKYISFSLGSLVFLDSLQFMSASLDKLVANMAEMGDAYFHVLKRHFPANKIPMLLRKGVYPYSYMNSPHKFAETSLPPREAFFNDLTNESVSKDDYDHAKAIWRLFDMKTMGDYHDLYLKTDTILLADVFERFRDVCIESYGLDACHYYTSPGLAWDACLKRTGVRLELLTDQDMHLFVEEGIRGGISTISNRYSRANNRYIPDQYDPNEPSKYIMYLDANNLYGWAMSEALPVSDFKWLSEEAIRDLDVTTVADDAQEGYILEVDLAYPTHLHDAHNDYPLAPENIDITVDMTSDYSKDLLKKLTHPSQTRTPNHVCGRKLVPNLFNKRRYVVHYRNLKFYLAQGMRLETIHRAIVFRQSPWLKSYIDFNTVKRKQATTDFAKDFYKLMNNAVFGKTMENLRNRMRVELVNSPDKFKKLIAKPNLKSFRIFTPHLAGVHLGKLTLYLNRPIYIGFSVLEVSKLLMYNFHYNHIKMKYGSKVKLLFTDTDSLCYEIETDDIYEDMQADSHLYDFSDYPITHPLHSNTNKKVLGKMKDETVGMPPEEFVGLKSKMYSLLCEEHDKKTAKGVKKSTLKRDITHQSYLQCLLREQTLMATMTQIRSYDHRVFTIKINKIGLSPYDDKRYVLDNGRDTLAYGHYRIKDTHHAH